MASLRHPYIVSVLDYGFASDGSPYFAMDYLPDTQTFTQAGQKQSSETLLQLVLQLLEALAYLHRRGFLHRDLKPSNVLVRDNMVHVVDLGLATSINNAHTDSVGGSLTYVAPEQLRKHHITPVSEQFSVGLMVYEMLNGDYPFPLSPAISIVNGIMNTDLDFTTFGLPDEVVAVLQRLVMKDSGQRYPSVQAAINDLRAALSLHEPEESRIIRESYLQAASFIGRQSELDQLQSALIKTKQGQSQVWILGGESGVGKSRLADEIRTHALIQGFEVFRGQAVEGGGLPFQPWREPIRHLLLSRPVDDLQAGILKEIVPDIEQLLDRSVTPIPPLDGSEHLERLIFAIVSLLRPTSQPILLLLEDLHWTTESLVVIQQVLKVLDQLPNLMVLGTYRQDERPNLVQHLPGVHTLTLNRLLDDEIIELSEAMLGDQGTASQLVSTLIQETEGNTFFIVEVIRTWAEEAGHLQNIGIQPISTNILTNGMQALLQRRIQQVPHGDQKLLKLAAVAGRQLDLNIIEALTSQEISSWLQRVSDAAIVTIIDGQWQFAHDKLREAILQELTDKVRPELHQAVAETIERAYPDNHDYYPILLELWHQAGDVDRQTYYLNFIAGHWVQERDYFEDAQRLLLRGLQQLDNTDYRRIALLNWLSESYSRRGRYRQGLECAHQAKELALLTDNQLGLGTSLYHIGTLLYFQGKYEDSRGSFLQSLDIVQQLDDKRRIALASKGLGSLFMNEGLFAEAKHFLSQSLEVAQQSGFQETMVLILISLGELALLQGDFVQAHEYLQQCFCICQELGTMFGKVVTLTYFGMLARTQKRLDEAYDYYTQALELAREIDNQHMIAHIYRRQGLVEYDLGNYRKAYDLHLRSLKMMEEINDQWTIAAIHNDLGFTCLQIGDDQAIPSFHTALTTAWSMWITPIILDGLIGFAWLYLQDNNPTQAAHLAGLVQHHPGFTTDVQLRLDILMPELEQALNPIDVQAALERGKELDLETVVNEVLTRET